MCKHRTKEQVTTAKNPLYLAASAGIAWLATSASNSCRHEKEGSLKQEKPDTNKVNVSQKAYITRAFCGLNQSVVLPHEMPVHCRLLPSYLFLIWQIICHWKPLWIRWRESCFLIGYLSKQDGSILSYQHCPLWSCTNL